MLHPTPRLRPSPFTSDHCEPQSSYYKPTISYLLLTPSTPSTTCRVLPYPFIPLQALPAAVRNASDAFEVSRGFVAHCTNMSYPTDACTALGVDVGGSLNGNLAKRPAAVCSRLGLCSATVGCNATAPSIVNPSVFSKGPLDVCTASGLLGGPLVRVDGEPINCSAPLHDRLTTCKAIVVKLHLKPRNQCPKGAYDRMALPPQPNLV